MIIDIFSFCSTKDASLGVYEAIKQAKSGDTVYFQKGEYHFFKERCQHRVYHMTNTDSFLKPDKYFAILLEDKENITIDGGGSVFVIHGDMCALAMVRCKNITLKNFTVRYNSPTNIEFTVVKKSFCAITYSLPDDCSFEIKGHNIYFYEESPFTSERYYQIKNDTKTYCDVIHRGDEVFRTIASPLRTAVGIRKTGEREIRCSYILPPKFKLGDVVTMSQNKCRDNCGLFFWQCSDILSENITVNYMHGFGWLSQMCENLEFSHISFTPAEGHVVTSFADCIHVCSCKGYVKIHDSLFSHAHDDGINIHGAFLRVKEVVDSHTLILEFVHNQQGGYSAFFAGNKVKFYSRTDLSEIGGVYTVKKAVDDIDAKTVAVTFEETLCDITSKVTVCENITYNPQVTVNNCIFRAIPTRGILCTTREKSEIFDNTFISLKMPDIFISCDCADWYESGPCKDMSIHDNTFSQKGAILIQPICLKKAVANVHENIGIFSNRAVRDGREINFEVVKK